jgi:hypothetical protein
MDHFLQVNVVPVGHGAARSRSFLQAPLQMHREQHWSYLKGGQFSLEAGLVSPPVRDPPSICIAFSYRLLKS